MPLESTLENPCDSGASGTQKDESDFALGWKGKRSVAFDIEGLGLRVQGLGVLCATVGILNPKP